MAGEVALAWISNASLAFLICALIVLPLVRVFRPLPSVRLGLGLLPFARLGLDLCAGIPSDVQVWYGLKGDYTKQVVLLLGHEGSPCSSPAIYCFGASAEAFGFYPTRLVAGVKAAVDGQWHSLGMGDILSRVLDQWLHGLPLLLFVTMAGVGSIVAGRRLLCAWHFERDRQALRRSKRSRSIARVRLWWRDVDVYLSDAHDGSPFTGGLFRPYICFPRHTFKRLRPSERRAVLAHELAHVRRLDALVIACLGLVNDMLWFVPLMGAVRRQVLYALELAADAASARLSGAAVTASAILRVGESLKQHPSLATYGLGAMSNGSFVRERIETLLWPRPRVGSLAGLAQFAVTAAVAFLTLSAAFFGYR